MDRRRIIAMLIAVVAFAFFAIGNAGIELSAMPEMDAACAAHCLNEALDDGSVPLQLASVLTAVVLAAFAFFPSTRLSTAPRVASTPVRRDRRRALFRQKRE